VSGAICERVLAAFHLRGDPPTRSGGQSHALGDLWEGQARFPEPHDVRDLFGEHSALPPRELPAPSRASARCDLLHGDPDPFGPPFRFERRDHWKEG
jgi:hypothetical protein